MSAVLVVEDEATIAELIAINLRHAGHDVCIAGAAEQARQVVNATLPDLVLLDWMLPGDSGLTLARQWRADPRTRALPVVVLSASLSDRTRDAALVLGASAALAKPFGSRELLRAVEAALASSALRAGGAA